MVTLKSLKSHPVFLMIVVTTIVLFTASSARHALFQSTVFDLAIFDQAIYLISQNQTPFSSLMAINIWGDHASFIFYPLALLYKIYPDVHWLFLVQAVSLALGAWPSWSLARQAG
jgi:Predicted membrane protein